MLGAFTGLCLSVEAECLLSFTKQHHGRHRVHVSCQPGKRVGVDSGTGSSSHVPQHLLSSRSYDCQCYHQTPRLKVTLKKTCKNGLSRINKLIYSLIFLIVEHLGDTEGQSGHKEVFTILT